MTIRAGTPRGSEQRFPASEVLRYVVRASKGDERFTEAAEGKASALDLIDQCVAAGCRIDHVVEQAGSKIDPMVLVDRLYGTGDASRSDLTHS